MRNGKFEEDIPRKKRAYYTKVPTGGSQLTWPVAGQAKKAVWDFGWR